jgi:predicted nucleic acid-binding protein
VIFVDTGAWFALVVPTDPDHRAAVAWFGSNRESACTSDYVVDETLTLLRARGEPHRALAMGRLFFAGQIALLHHLSEADVLEAWRVFERFSDKAWSFTDCTSEVLMNRLGMTQAFAFDEHFRQFGVVTVHPEKA